MTVNELGRKVHPYKSVRLDPVAVIPDIVPNGTSWPLDQHGSMIGQLSLKATGQGRLVS